MSWLPPAPTLRRPRFEVFESADGWRWRLVSGNGETIAVGEGHTRAADAKRAAKTVKRTARLAKVESTR